MTHVLSDKARRYVIALCLLGLAGDAVWVNWKNLELKNMLMGKVPIRQAKDGLEIGDRAPSFELPTLEGRPFQLRDARGAPLTLIYFSPDCEICEREVPLWRCLQEATTAAGGMTIGVSAAKREEVAVFRSHHQLTFPCLVDSAGVVAKRFKVRGTPTVIQIDRAGKVANVLAGGV